MVPLNRRFLYFILLILVVFSEFGFAGEAGVVERSGAGIPFKESSTASDGSLPNVALVSGLAVALSVGIIFLIRRLYRLKYGVSSGDNRRIVFVEGKMITPKVTVALINVDGKAYLLAQCGDNIQLKRHYDHEVMDNNNEA
ncbi:flagellar biosynthetic protein FliO [Marinobacterium sp. D7]|uniref:flagellar biosynthetic protein FliO n=1 Tax=Marinobacterium ramblicola TaxID=2849041 RepID=UPI001C2D6B2D|nr:flagellar biosynthetic protein FliO [Marinobacterium ramblicola]MBV1787715.1 flagellar biosynthetic protein FliO [Marinobacterium ramblicola]